MFFFQIQCLKGYFPPISEIIAFVLLAKILWRLAREKQDRIEKFGLFVDHFMEKPVALARTFPEFNQVLLMMWEECYDLRLGSSCNLGKDLRKDRDRVQLVKRKEYRVVSMLYIHIVHEASVWSIWEKWVIEHEDEARTVYLLYEVLTELYVAQPIMLSLPFAHIYAASRRCRS